jgi:hypothetical protein
LSTYVVGPANENCINSPFELARGQASGAECISVAAENRPWQFDGYSKWWSKTGLDARWSNELVVEEEGTMDRWPAIYTLAGGSLSLLVRARERFVSVLQYSPVILLQSVLRFL